MQRSASRASQVQPPPAAPRQKARPIAGSVLPARKVAASHTPIGIGGEAGAQTTFAELRKTLIAWEDRLHRSRKV